MLDIGKLKYRLILLDENGVQYDLKDVVQDLGYEENENELASRITFRLADVDGGFGAVQEWPNGISAGRI